MLEDSISSSPSKSNKSIHETRLIRKNKRRKAEGVLSINSDHQEQHICPPISIHDFYKDSEEESTDANESKDSTFIVTKPSAIIENYKPFEMEKCLAIADHISTHQKIKENNTTMWPETQGFLSCLNLTQLEKEKPNTSLSITESELISCCHDAEKELQDDYANSSRVQELSPKKNDDMFLVNSILKDFSQSPLSADQNRTNTSYQYTPEFRLRKQPLKTYSRKSLNTTKTNLSQRFEEQATADTEDDDHQSHCSSLSIQEDVTMIEISNNHCATSSNSSNTQRLCENLLNLSVYFAQNSQTHSNLSDESQLDSNDSCSLDNDQSSILCLSNIPDLIQDILTLRSNSNKRYDSFNSLDGFLGFHSRKDDERDVIDMDSTELDIMQTTLTHDYQIDNNPVHDTSLCGEEIWNEDDFAGINTENILAEENIKTPNNIKENSAEFNSLLATKSSEIPTAPENLNHDHMLQKSIGFKTASSKPIKVSREAHIMAAKILSQLPEIPEFQKNPKPNNCDTKDEDIFENPENYKWNDDCDLFLNFQTPIVLKEKPTTEPEQQLNTNEVEIPIGTSMGFKTAGGKNVRISKKAQETVQILLKEFTNSEPNDNFKCEEELKELKCKVYAKTHNIETNPASLSDIKENNITKELQVSQQLQVVPSTSKMASVGFKTAGGNNVHISKKAQETVQKLLNEFTNSEPEDNFNCEEELKELKCKVYAKTHNIENNPASLSDIRENNITKELQDSQQLQVVPSTSKMASVGFKTAGGKNVHISKKARETVQKLLKEFTNSEHNDNFNCEEELKELKCKVYAKTHNFESNKSSQNNTKEIKSTNELQESHPTILSDMKENNCSKEMQVHVVPSTSNGTSVGFKTAGGKNVHISKKAQETVQKLLNEFTNYDHKEHINCEEELKELKCKVYAKTHNFESTQSSTNNKNIEFHTNRDDNLPIFLKTQHNEDKMLNEFCKEAEQNFENNMKIINMADNQQTTELKENLSDIVLSEWPSAKETAPEIINNRTNMENSCNKNNGFTNVNGKQVEMSTKAQKTVENLVKEFNTDLNLEKFENDFVEMKLNNSNSMKPQTSTIHVDTSFSEGPTNSKIFTPKPSKRKHSIDNSDIASPGLSSSPPAKVLNKGLSKSKSSFAEQSHKSPLTPRLVIGRKNLLSLTKRRINKRNSLTMPNEEIPKIHKEKYDLNVNAATPIKTSVSLGIIAQTPATPNLKEFISNAALTSTPRLNITSDSPKIIKDTDFKPINWRNNPNDSINNKSNNNTSTHTTKLSETSTLNITLNSSNPTAQERIGRLKMYGKAPAVSPIIMETNRNCRPSGLRRSTRSMLKHTEK